MRACKSNLLYPLLLMLLLVGCSDKGVEPVASTEGIALTAAECSVQEISLGIKLDPVYANATVSLLRDGNPVAVYRAGSLDTVVTDTALTPETSYRYTLEVEHECSTLRFPARTELTATTLAPSSHNFTWQTFTIGEGGSSTLYGVSIVNDTLAYAVGDFHLKKISGETDPILYNFAVWNGTSWSPERVYYTYNGVLGLTYFSSVFAFSSTDIWVGATQPMHWDGSSWKLHTLPPSTFYGWIYGMWGSSSKDFYIMGDNGSLAHYDGGSWQKIETGTQMSFIDGWGVKRSEGSEAWCLARDPVNLTMNRFLRISQSTVLDSVALPPERGFSSVWTADGSALYLAGDGVYKKVGHGSWRAMPVSTRVYIQCVRSNGLNDIVVSGDFGVLCHYNGLNWQIFSFGANIAFPRVDIKGNLVIAVGNGGYHGIAVVGRRG